MRFFSKIVSIGFLALAMMPLASQAATNTYYWDVNDAAAGFGTANGAWGSNTFWSTDGTGASVPSVLTTTTSDSLNFGNGATGLGAGTIGLDGTQAAGSLTFASGSGAIILSGGTINLAVPGSITVNNISNTISSVISGSAGLNKYGSGTLTLAGINTYTGGTIISNGTLLVNGSITSAVTVISGASLGGTGTINGNAILSSGAMALLTTGTPLNITGSLTLNNNVVHLNLPNSLSLGTYRLINFNPSGSTGAFAVTPVINSGSALGTTRLVMGSGTVDLVIERLGTAFSISSTPGSGGSMNSIPFADSFEEYSLYSSIIGSNGWTGFTNTATFTTNGNPSVVNPPFWTNYTGLLPLNGSSHTKVISFNTENGTVSNIFNSSSYPTVWFDGMVKYYYWNDDNPPAFTNDTGSQMGAYVNSNGNLVVCHSVTPEGSTFSNVFTVLTGAVIASNEWIRLTITLDYLTDVNYLLQFFKVQVNGQTALTSAQGYSDITTYTPGSPDNGAWHICATPGGGAPTHTYPASFIYGGEGYIDDFVVTNGQVTFTQPLIVDNATGASGITTNSATLKGILTSAGGTNGANVTIYWGPIDQSTNTVSWATNSSLGWRGTGLFTNNVSGLLPGSNYFYRCYASNAFGDAWAPSTTNFMTSAGGTMPTINISIATGITSNSATLNANLVSMGSDTSVWTRIYWGLTNGLANEANWASFADLGLRTNTGAINTNIGGLSPATLYWYRAWASNSVGRLWSSGITNFTTAPISMPTVVNAGASGVTTNAATLNGNLTSGGGTNGAFVTIYWGLIDQSTNTLSWATNSFLGWLGTGPFSTNIQSLISNTQYFYRCYASNAFGTAWAPSTTNFITLPSGGPPMKHLRLYGIPVAIQSGQSASMTVEAWDGTNIWTSYTGTVHFAGSDGSVTVPGDYQFQPADNGIRVFSNTVSFGTAGEHWMVEAYDTSDFTIWGDQHDIIVFNGYNSTATKLAVSGIGDPCSSGQLHTVTIAALGPNNEQVTNYINQVTFTSSDGSATLPNAGSYTFTGGEMGVHTFSNGLVFTTIGEQWFKAVQTINSNIWGKVYDITVEGEGESTNVTHFVIEGSRWTLTNEWHDLSIEARNMYEKVVTNFTGTVNFYCSDTQALYQSSYNFIAGDEGMHTFTNTFGYLFKTPGPNQWIKAQWQADTNINGTLSEIYVESGILPRLELFHNLNIPGNVIAGRWVNVTVSAWSVTGEIDSNYTGTVIFSTENQGVDFSLTNYTFSVGDAGIHVFTNLVRYNTSGNNGENMLKVEEQGTPSKFDMSDVNVLIGGATNTTRFVAVPNPYPLLSNTWHDVFIVAMGDGDLVNTNFSGNVQFSTSDGAASFAANPLGGFTDGMLLATNQLCFRTPGDQTFRVQWQSDTNVCMNDKVFVAGGGNYYYVDKKTGSDSSNGLSTASAWQTIGRAMSTVTAGDVVIIGAETYNESINFTASGTAGKWITLYADNEGRWFSNIYSDVEINPGSSQPAFTIDTKSYMALCGFSISQSGSSTGVVINSSDNVRLYHMNANNMNGGFLVQNSPDTVIYKASVGTCSAYGLSIIGASANTTVEDLEAEDCMIGVKVQNATTNIVFTNCYVSANTIGGIEVSNSSVRVSSSWISGNTGFGLHFDPSLPCFAFNNAIYNNGDNGILLHSPGSVVQNNTIENNGPCGIAVELASGCDIRNNISVLNAQAGIFVDAASTNGLLESYNDCFGNSVSNWAGVVPGAGSITADPLLASTVYPQEDFHLKSQGGRLTLNGWTNDLVTSPCIDAGDPGLPWANEPMPNGGRADMGVYGNTWGASRTMMLSITANSGPNGTIAPTGVTMVAYGSNLTYTISPSNNYHVLDVTIDGTNSIGSTNSYTFLNVTNNGHTINATFTLDSYTLSVTSVWGTPGPSGVTTNIWNSPINASVNTPVSAGGYTQYVCSGYSGTGSAPSSGTSNSAAFNITNTSTLAWNWKTQYLYTAAAGLNGSITAYSNGWYDAGTPSVSVTAVPDNGYLFGSWTGAVTSTNNPLVMTVTNVVNVTANFIISSNDVTSSANPNGSISPLGTVWVPYNGSTNFIITPNPNYHVLNILYDGVTNAAVTNFMVSNITNGGHTVVASFAIDTNSVMSSAGPNGSISPDGTVWVPYGSNITYTITPSNNYHVLAVTIDSTNNIGATNSYTFVNVTNSTHMINVTFTIDEYALTVTSPWGAPTPSGVTTNTWNLPINASVPTPVSAGGYTQYVCSGYSGTGSAPSSGTSNSAAFNITNTSTLAWNWKTQYLYTATAGLNGSITAYSNGWYDSGTPSVSVTAVPDNGYLFGSWTGAVTSTNNPLVMTVTNVVNVTANFIISSNDVTSSANPNGSISPLGTVWVPYNGSTNFIITPNPNYHVLNILYDGVTNAAVTNFPVNNITNGGHTVVASFAIDTNSVMSSAGPNGSISPDGTVWVPYGSNITYTITPSNNYHVLAVTIDSTNNIGATNSYTFVNVTNSTHMINATFAIDEYTLTVNSDHGAPTPGGVSTNSWNTPVNASVTPSVPDGATTQYLCTGWTGSGSIPSSGTSNSISFNITNTTFLTWNWSTNYYLNIMAGANGGINTTSSWYLAGSNVTVTATPTNLYRFTGWTGDIVSTNNPLNISMTQGYPSITANFAPAFFDVMVSAPINGSVAPSGTVWVGFASNMTFNVTPDPGYHILNVTIDGTNSIGATNSYTFINVTNGGHMVNATFAIDDFTLTVISPYGPPTPSGVTTNAWNSPIMASVPTMVPNGASTQYVCTGWAGSGSVPVSGTSNTVSFNITNISTLVWNWATQYWLNVSSGPNGSVNVPSCWTNAGANAVITATPLFGYHFAGWTGDVPPAQTNDTPLTLAMTQARSITANFSMNVGSVTVTISPTNATAMGAQWMMTTGPDTAWHTNGFVISGVQGTGAPYTIAFNNIGAFTTPANITNVSISHSATTTVNATYMLGSMVLIPGGTFTMGIYQGVGGVQVTLSDFYVDVKEVTVGEFQSFCTNTATPMPTAPAWGWGNTNQPMVNVSWNLASAYATWAGKRLLTEAEYEYVMRSGAPDQLYPWGNTIGAGNANYFQNAGAQPSAVGSYSANAYGVYDISGNVWEWCNDWYQSLLTGPVTNPTGAVSGSAKVCRGGSWASAAFTLQCAPRYNIDPAKGYNDLGFRCAVTAGGGGSAGGVKTVNPANKGVPDWWAQYYFGLAGFDPDADSDSDGVSNWKEYLTGTDPLDKGSAFKIKNLKHSAANGFEIQWTSSSGKKYRIERASDLMQGFSPLATNILATPPFNTFIDTNSTGAVYFYRTKIE